MKDKSNEVGVTLVVTKGERTREAILDAAEGAFARHGFDGVPMRQVAELSGQALGVLTYHFASKEKLFETVVSRRAQAVNVLRYRELEKFENPDLEDILSALLGPFVDLIEHGGMGWKAYAHLLAQISHEERWADLLSELFGETARVFIRAIRNAEPGLSLLAAKRAYVHVVAVMVGLFASTPLIDRLSGTMVDDDLPEHYRSAIKFASAGVRALAR